MPSIVLQPAGNGAAASHYATTIASPAEISGARLAALTQAQRQELEAVYPGTPLRVAIWGVTATSASRWDRMAPGDFAFFARANHLFSGGTVTNKFRNPRLANLLWGDQKGPDGSSETWEYMYTLDHLRPFNISYPEMNRLAGYELNNIVRGFSVLDEERSALFFDTYALPDSSLAVQSPPVPDPPFQFDPNAETDRWVLTRQRLEQEALRQHLGLSGGGFQNCDLCGEVFPPSLLVAGHIKKRAACSDEERNDRQNIAMRCCLLGCDSLYEDGRIYVDSAGEIHVNPRKGSTPPVTRHLELFAGRQCAAFRPETQAYFQWHRENKASAAQPWPAP
jgi:hypothetical protein